MQEKLKGSIIETYPAIAFVVSIDQDTTRIFIKMPFEYMICHLHSFDSDILNNFFIEFVII